MFLQGYPTSDKATSLASVRRDLEGAVVRDATGKLRAGVFPSHTGELVARRPDMRLDILDFRAVQDKRGACFIANEGTTQSPAFGAAPAANKRIDVLYVTQKISTIDGGTTAIEARIVQGAASPTPVRPAIPAQYGDAIPFYAVEIPAGATSMQSAGVILTPLFPYTATAGGTVVVRSMVELGGWKPSNGSAARGMWDDCLYQRRGEAWWREEERTASPVLSGAPAASSGWTYQDFTQIVFSSPFAAPPEVKVSVVVGWGSVQTEQIFEVTTVGFKMRGIRLGAQPAPPVVSYRAVGRVA